MEPEDRDGKWTKRWPQRTTTYVLAAVIIVLSTLIVGITVFPFFAQARLEARTTARNQTARLDWAIAIGDVDLVAKLLPLLPQSGSTRYRDAIRFTQINALTVSAQTGDVAGLYRWLDRFSESDVRAVKDVKNPLLAAVYGGNIQSVRLLLDRGWNPDGTWDDGSPLCSAAAWGRPDIVTLLLEHGAHVDYSPSYDGRTALMAAATVGNSVVVRLLLAKGASLGLTSKYGETALSLARLRNRKDVISILIHAIQDKSNKGPA